MLKFLIPTAKEMAELSPVSQHFQTEKSNLIAQTTAKLSSSELEEVYKIKAESAAKEALRWRSLAKQEANYFPALKLFNGLMYRNMDRDFLTDLANIDQKVFITSALYGVIPAMTPIAPHRLDFNTKLKIDGASLKQFWRPDYDQALTSEDTVISLLSSEFEDVFSPQKRQQLTSIQFREIQDGKTKTHSTISKKARGQFLTQALKNDCQNLDDLKMIEFNGFRYNDKLSQTKLLVFTKEIN